MRTYSVTPSDIEREWLVVDAQGQTLGRLATRIAFVLRGKHKPLYTPHLDCGDFVIVVNADKIQVTGRKLDQKMYYRHSGYPGGLGRSSCASSCRFTRSGSLSLQCAVCFPRPGSGGAVSRKLKVYAGPTHPHQAQRPKALEIA